MCPHRPGAAAVTRLPDVDVLLAVSAGQSPSSRARPVECIALIVVCIAANRVDLVR
jgi:hypothetical protein